MENTKKYNLIWGGIIGVVLTLLLLKACSGVINSPCPEITITHDTIETQKYDSVPKYIDVPHYLPSDSFIVEIPQHIDTSAILDRYFKAFVYNRVLQNDSIRITLIDTVSQNRITGSAPLKYQFLFPIKTTTIINTTKIDTTKKNKVKIFVGITTGASKQGLQTIAPEVMLTTQKNYSFKLGYNILKNEVQAGIGYVPQLKRNRK